MKNERDGISELEQKVAGLRRAVIYLSVLTLISYASLLFVFSKTASVRWIAINDRQGHITGWWDDQGLKLFDAKGVARLRIGMDGDQPSLQMFDDSHKLKAQVFLYTDGSGYLMLWDKNGKGSRFPVPETPLP